MLKYVKTRIKTLYPERFQNPNRSRPSSVEGSSTASTRNSESRDTFMLTDDEKRAMNTFVRQGVMTKEEYIKEIKRVKGVQ